MATAAFANPIPGRCYNFGMDPAGVSPSSAALLVAIDGPVASGKSSVGKAAALQTGLRFLDTGIMYRAVTWLVIQRGIPAGDADAVAGLASGCRMELPENPGSGSAIVVDGMPLAGELVTPDVDQNVSAVSAVPAVRVELVRQQREIARSGGMVMVGRDIGSVVLPNADLKLYIDATPEERARRRHAQVVQVDPTIGYEQVLADTLRRDRLDMEREDSPLAAASDALIIQTDDMDFEQTVLAVVSAIRSVGCGGRSAKSQG